MKLLSGKKQNFFIPVGTSVIISSEILMVGVAEVPLEQPVDSVIQWKTS